MTDTAHKIGKTMMTIAWCIVLVLLTWGFGFWEEKQYNPNSQPQSTQSSELNQVTLIRNRYDHYVTSGKINNKKVTFLLDTGATDVVIPASLANNLSLIRGRESYAATANGVITVYSTIIDKLEVGPIILSQVDASINPNMSGKEILLGMSALKDIEFTQRGDELTLKQFAN